VASRQQEKERRRQERLAREAEAAAAERRRRVIGVASGGVLVVGIIVAIVVAVSSGGGGSNAGGKNTPQLKPTPKVAIPAAQITNLNAAARAAGCQLHTYIPGPHDRDHVLSRVNYKQNPPVFGPHNPIPAHDGDYAGQSPPSTEQLVHPLEHGRVIIWYQPSLSSRDVAQLETLFVEPIVGGAPQGYKQILVERPGMPFQVAATAWGQQLGCPKFNPKVFDAIRTFRRAYVDHGPEQVPFPE
jgi:hypothetical protein